MMRFVQILSLLIVMTWLFPKACLERIDPDEIGVRRSLTGGISEEDFGVGYHLSLPLWHRWYALPGTVHYLDFSSDTGEPLDVRTNENNVIIIDVTIPYVVQPGSGWQIVKEGFNTDYPAKVKSAAIGILRENLARLSNRDVQDPLKRKEIAESTLPLLNAALAQYHIAASHVVLRAIAFRPQYEAQLQRKQLFSVQAELDEALKLRSEAETKTETVEKSIEKDVAVKEEEWNKKIEELKSEYQLEIAEIEAQAVEYDRRRRAEADAGYTKLTSEGDLAEALAEALGEKLKAQAVATKAGRTFSAIEAARNFELGSVVLNSSDPSFLYDFGSMQAWRRFFLGE